MATETEIDEVWGLAAAAYPHFKAPAATLLLWGKLLADIPGAVLRAAVLKCITDSEFFPTVHALRAAATDIQASGRQTGLEAWGRVRDAIRKHGDYHPPKGTAYVLAAGNYEWDFDDPLAAVVVRSMGWAYLCQSDEVMADRAHFLKAYEAIRDREYSAAAELPAVAQARALVAGEAAQLLATVAGTLAGAPRLRGGR